MVQGTLFQSSTHSNSTVFNLDLNKPTTAFVVVIVVCAVVFPITFITFSFLRPRIRRIYAPRLLLLEEKLCPLGKLPSSLLAWVSPAYMLSDDDLFNHISLDALVFMRFFRLCLKFALFTMPFGLILLLPLNLHGGHNLPDPLDRMSVTNIKSESGKLWAHWVCVWIYSAVGLYLVYEEWKVFVLYRQAYLSKGKGKEYVVLLYDLDPQIMTDEGLQQFVESLFPGKVFSTYLVKDLTQWDKLIKQHDLLVKKLEHEKVTGKLTFSESQKLVTDKSTKILKYEKKLQILQVRLEEEQFSSQKALPVAFIVFNSVSARMSALQTSWDLQALLNLTQPGCEPNEIVWKSFLIPRFRRRCRFGIGEGLVVLSLLSWSPVVAFISTFKNLKALAKQYSFVNDIIKNMPDVIISLLQGVIPVLLLQLLYWILPFMFRKISRFQGVFSMVGIEKMVFRNLILFNLCNTFFVFVVSSSFFGVIYNVLSVMDTVSSLPELLASSLPSQANFYINMIALLTFCGHVFELIQPYPLLKYGILSKWFAKTPREKLEAWEPDRPKYSEKVSSGLLVFMVGLAYSVLSPLIVPFLVLYFGLGYVVWAYQLVHVYIPKYDLGGELWPMIYSRFVVGIVVFQLLMIGVFFLKGSFFTGGLLFVLVFVTLIFWYWIGKCFAPLGDRLARSTVTDVKEPESTFLAVVRDSYIRNCVLPGMHDVSTDVKSPLFEYESYTPTNVDNDQELEGRIGSGYHTT